MNKLTHCLAGLLLFVAALSQTAMASDLKLVHSGNWPPYAGNGSVRTPWLEQSLSSATAAGPR